MCLQKELLVAFGGRQHMLIITCRKWSFWFCLNNLNIFQCQVCTESSSVVNSKRIWSSSFNKQVVYPSNLFQKSYRNNNVEGWAMALAQCCECKTSSIVRRVSEKHAHSFFCCNWRFPQMGCQLLWWVGKPAESQKLPLAVCLETRLPFLGREKRFGPMR